MDTQKDNFSDVKKEVQTRFELLPAEIKNIITSSDYQMKLFETAKKYKLTYEQLAKLELETTMVLLGVSNPANYEKDLESELGKKPGELAEMIGEIKNEVFGPIRASLMSLYSKETSDEDSDDETLSPDTATQTVMSQSGISLGKDLPATTPTATVTEDRASMLQSIENPTKSSPKVLNEMAKPTTPMPGIAPIKPLGADIPVPRAPYAGGAPSADAVKQPIPMTAKPTGDILVGKLGGTFGVPAKETDHSIKSMGATPAPQPKTGGDSYREPVE